MMVTIEATKSKKVLRTRVTFRPSLLKVQINFFTIIINTITVVITAIVITIIIVISTIIVIDTSTVVYQPPVNEWDGDDVAEHLNRGRERNWKDGIETTQGVCWGIRSHIEMKDKKGVLTKPGSLGLVHGNACPWVVWLEIVGQGNLDVYN